MPFHCPRKPTAQRLSASSATVEERYFRDGASDDDQRSWKPRGYARSVALGAKGSRSIVVDGLPYRWKVRHKPSYAQLLGNSDLVFAVERSDISGQVLVVDTGQVRADAALLPDSAAAVTPG